MRLHLGGCGHGSASRLWGCWRTWRGCQWQSSWWENEDDDNYDEDWGKKKGVNVNKTKYTVRDSSNESQKEKRSEKRLAQLCITWFLVVLGQSGAVLDGTWSV